MAQDNSVAAGKLPYRTKTVVLAAGGSIDIPGNIKFLTLISATNLAKVQVSFNGSSFSAFPPGFNLRDFEAEIFWLKNTDVVSNTIVVAIGQADLRDSRVVIDAANPLPVTITSGSVNATLVGTAGNNADAEAVKATGLSEVESYPRVFNGTTMDRLRGDTKGILAQGPVAAGVAADGNPLPLGGPRTTDGVVVRFKGDVNGAQVVRAWDGTNFMPTMDAAARRGYQTITDGTNSMPTMDAAARRGYVQLTDGTNVCQVVGNNTTTIGIGPTVLSGVASTLASTQSYTTGRAAAMALDLNGNVYVTGQVAAGSAIRGNPVVCGGYDGTNGQWFRAIADNATVPSAGNQTVIPARYDSATRSLTSGAAAFLSVDATGAHILGNSNKASFSFNMADVAATTSTFNSLTIEQPASPTKTIYLKRLIIWNPGKLTSAASIIVQLMRQTTASSVGDGALVPALKDGNDSATAVGRYGITTSVTAGTLGNAAYSATVWAPTTVGVAAPVIVDLTNGGTTKGIVIPKTANNGILIRVGGGAGGANFSYSVDWTEEAP